MPPISTPTAGLNALDLFSEFGFQEDYTKTTGKSAPSLDRSKPLKSWFDPNALTAPNGPGQSGILYMDGQVLYPILILAAQTSDQKQSGDWTVFATDMILSRSDAASVNLMSSDKKNPDNVASAGQTTTPVPRRALESGEEIKSLNPFGGPQVINKALYAAQQQQEQEASGKFTSQDRALLQAIAAKLGV